MMLADIMIKPLSGFYFERFRDKLMNGGNVKLQPLPRREKVKKVKFELSK
jgi:hypothetical protein